jgi:DNA-directed RNA polymerase specialized sigma24 family protein
MSASDLCHFVSLLLSRLARREQQVFVLRYLLGLDGSEIAVVFGVTPVSVTRTIRRIERKARAVTAQEGA